MRRPLIHFLCALLLSIWVGGFTFYSAVVIPVLHDAMSSRESGMITQRVTDYLNGAGLLTLGCWWLMVWIERSDAESRRSRSRLALLCATTFVLIALVLLHRVMDGRIASGSLEGFYPLHRVYLIASTVQWFLNLGLIALIPSPRKDPEADADARTPETAMERA